MSNEELINALTTKFPDAEVKQGNQYPEIAVQLAELHATAVVLKTAPELAFDYMVCLSGVDYPEHIAVVYHLESTVQGHFIVLKVKTADREQPEVETLSDLWPTAEFHEREVFDLLGVKFSKHPDLRRLFLDESWGYPLRKDYVDDIHVVER
jgi:NADH-quinone oxidoreductase subunit C